MDKSEKLRILKDTLGKMKEYGHKFICNAMENSDNGLNMTLTKVMFTDLRIPEAMEMCGGEPWTGKLSLPFQKRDVRLYPPDDYKKWKITILETAIKLVEDEQD